MGGIPARYDKVVVGLCFIVLVAAMVRMHRLGERSITHPEIYTPGIELPFDLSDPSPRYTFAKVITGAIAAEPHPPGYYLLMLVWTKNFGTDEFTIRFPSVLFGVASVVLIFVLCRMEDGGPTPIFASAMLALNGLHIFWSQEARMYSMACFLGILSTVFLTACYQKGMERFAYLYFIVTLAGLGTVVYFWPIFLTQIIWVIAVSWRNQGSRPGLLRLQVLIFVLASPLFAIAAYQSGRESYLGGGLLHGVGEFLQLGYLLQPDVLAPSPKPISLPLVFVSIAIAVFLFALGLRKGSTAPTGKGVTVSPPPRVTAISGALMVAVIVVFAKFAHEKDPSRTLWVIATALIPVVLVLLDALLRRHWNRLQCWGSLLREKFTFVRHLGSVSLALAILPVSMIAGASLFIPLFAPRGVLLYVPYFIVVLSRGLTSLGGRAAARAVVVLVVLAIHALSVFHAHQIHHTVRDYKALAEKWVPKIEENDFIFVRRHWTITPIFYYMHDSDYRFVGWDYSRELGASPGSRVWVLTSGFPMVEEVADALAAYERTDEVAVRNLWAELYTRN